VVRALLGWLLADAGPWGRLGRDLAVLAVAAALFAGLFALGDLAVYGHVRW
jgi:hypothetical protein